jgi:hypothetical protein
MGHWLMVKAAPGVTRGRIIGTQSGRPCSGSNDEELGNLGADKAR